MRGTIGPPLHARRALRVDVGVAVQALAVTASSLLLVLIVLPWGQKNEETLFFLLGHREQRRALVFTA